MDALAAGLAMTLAWGGAEAGPVTALRGPAIEWERGTRSGWTVERDPFTDLWFHGLAVVGFDGFGDAPLYSPAYAAAVAERHRLGHGEATPLEAARGSLLAAFASDPRFEVLHFVPLYLHGMDAGEALEVLAYVGHRAGTSPHDAHGADTRIRTVVESLEGVLGSSDNHRVLRTFVELLRHERGRVTAVEVAELRGVARSWEALAAGPFQAFLEREALPAGRILLSPALGREGRFLRTGERTGLLVVGAPGASGSDSVVGAAVRELCFPAVRRVLEPHESRLGDRTTLTEVSHRLATRCGQRLLQAHAPHLLPAFEERFLVERRGVGLTSVPGLGPGAAALEGELYRALEGELNLEPDGRRPEGRPVGR